MMTRDIDHIFFKNDCIYHHRTLRINYTSYDVRRAQDVINPNTSHSDVMVLCNSAEEELERWQYGRVIGIHHVNVVYTGTGMIDYQPQRLEFLQVRWFQQPIKDRHEEKNNWESLQLDCLEFLPIDEQDAFGFLDPADVVRSAHIIPRFSQGDTPYTETSQLKKKRDWQLYYVNRSVLLPVFILCSYHLECPAAIDLLTVIWLCATTGVWG